MATTTVANMDYPYFSTPSIINELRSNKSSSPSFRVEEFFLTNKVATTQPAQSKQTYALVLIDGQPLVITQNTEAQIENPLNNTNIQSVAPLAVRLDLIKSRLALSVTQLAELFGVTRKAIYDWYDGAEPRSAATIRMELLIDILNTAPERIDLQRLKAVWNIPVSGKSFLAVFGDDKLDPTALRTLLKEKLDELYPRLVATTKEMQRTTTQLGEAHLAEFDRRTDFS